MKTQIRLLLLTMTVFVATVSVLRAQVVNDGASNTLSNATNQFSAAGGFPLTNGIPPAQPQRFFRLRTP